MESATGMNASNVVTIVDGTQRVEVVASELNKTILICCYTPVIIFTVIGNLMVLVAFCRYKDVRAIPTNIIILSLSIADFIVGFVVLPVELVWRHNGDWIFGETFCRVWAAVDYTVYFSSVISIITISFDRFLLVTTKTRYRTIWTHRRVSAICAASWLFSVTWGFVIGFSFRHLGLVDFSNECEMEIVYLLRYFLALLVFDFAIPFTLISLLNAVVYSEIYKRSRKLGPVKIERDSSNQAPSTNETQVENASRATGNETSTSNVNDGPVNARPMAPAPASNPGGDTAAAAGSGQDGGGAPSSSDQRSDAVKKQQKQYSKHRKAAITLSILVGTFVLCWLPFHIIGIVQASCGNDECFPDAAWEAVSGLLWGNSMLNPILYGLTNPMLRRRMLGSFRPTRAVGHS